MSEPKTPQLFGTEKDYAWDAWQKAFDAGTLLPDRAKFEKYFDEVYLKLGAYPLRERLNSAWNSGVLDRNEQGTAGFNAWWQEILDSQPTTSG
jgi:hypothetical protein